MKFPVPELFSSFTWSDPSPPLSSLMWPSIIVPLYLLTIYAIQYHVKHHRGNKPYNVTLLFGYHNLLMSLLSLIMFVGCLIEVIRRTAHEASLSWLICEPRGNPPTGSLYFWSYVYYLSKYYELLDTVFLALKGKLDGWGGLNVYHHSVVVFMAWWWLEYAMSLQFYGLLFNTSVHVIMYYYFYLRSVGQVPTWRSFITKYPHSAHTTHITHHLPRQLYHSCLPAALPPAPRLVGVELNPGPDIKAWMIAGLDRTTRLPSTREREVQEEAGEESQRGTRRARRESARRG